ncbi:unnamed protein product [Alternaria alternata]
MAHAGVYMAGSLGHLWKLPRTVVATTRTKVSMQFFGPLSEFINPTNSIPSKHPLREMFSQLHKRGHVYRLTSIERKSFEQYEPVLEAPGLITARSEHWIFR